MLHRLLAAERARELRAAAEADRLARPPIPRRAHTLDHAVTIRYAFPDDAAALRRLAALDSAEAPAAPVLVAEVDGRLRVALSLADGQVVADPFHTTLPLVELLRARARQLATSRPFASGRSRRRPAVLSVIQKKLQTRPSDSGPI